MSKECGLKSEMRGKNKEKCVNGAIVPDSYGLATTKGEGTSLGSISKGEYVGVGDYTKVREA